MKKHHLELTGKQDEQLLHVASEFVPNRITTPAEDARREPFFLAADEQTQETIVHLLDDIVHDRITEIVDEDGKVIAYVDRRVAVDLCRALNAAYTIARGSRT